MEKGYEFLIEKEEMWAKVLIEVLRDNGIPYATHAVHGVAYCLKTGVKERLQIFVPAEYLEEATKLTEELFAASPEDEAEADDVVRPVVKNDKNGKEDTTHYLPLYMSIGLSVGLAIGASVGNIPMGMCIGLGAGVCLGAALDSMNKKKSEDDSKSDEDGTEE